MHQSRARYRSVMAGRQSGKTRTGISEICVDAMGFAGHIDWWVAPNYKVKDKPWRELLEFLPPKVIRKKWENELRIALVNGSEIFVKSADAPDSLVSEGLHFAVCDEAGQWKETAWTMGIRPMFGATGGRAMLIGTPRGKNWFYKLWRLGWRKAACAICATDPVKCTEHHPDYDSFHWKTEDSPFSTPSDIEEARRNLPRDIFKQEYEADPLDNSGGVFKNVRNCVVGGVAAADRFTCIGVDLARKGDFSAFIPMNSQRRALFVERSQEDWPVQKARLARMSIENNFARMVMDSASVGDVVVQDMRTAGYAVEDIPTNSTTQKRALIDNLRLAFEQNTIQIPNDETLIGELEAYSYEILPHSNQIRYSAPDGQHDDTVIALSLALWGQRGALARPAAYATRDSYLGRGRGESYMRRRSA